ncbi:MAG: FG-GAP-like repeat-containing protein [Kofleriaceae bacterium]
MRSVAVAALLVFAACGDNQTGPALEQSDQVVVVAHQDDDHLFMQPDLSDALLAGTSTTIVYVTAGDANSGLPFALSRLEASKAAYGVLLGSQDWNCGWIDFADHWMEHCRLGKLSLVFMGYPDGGVGGEFPHSLLRLFQGEFQNAETVAEHTSTYSRISLVDTVTKIFDATQPMIIRSLEIAGTHADDHTDHLLVGTIAMLAAQRTTARAELLSYRGYNVNYEPATNPEELYDYVSLPMRSYEACVTGCDGVCGQTPCSAITDPRYYNFLHRRYAIAMRERPLEGILHTDTGCLHADAGVLTVQADCTTAADVTLRDDGLIQIGDQCIDQYGALGDCTNTIDHRFMFDDEGHLWSALLVYPQPGLATMHAMCLVGNETSVGVDLCGSQNDFKWDLMKPAVVTQRMQAPTASAIGRAVRMADMTGDGLADLCFVGHGGLQCRVGDGTGHFGSPQTIIPVLAIEPQSLALGDVDFDGRADACGRDMDGLIVCATAQANWQVAMWSDAFVADDTTTADQSLSIVHGSVCASTESGMTCSEPGDVESILSTWPVQNAAGAPAFLADLDGDGQPDWCVTTSGGASCSVSSEANITDDGVAWGFSNHALVDGSAKVDGTVDDVARSAIGDISGDGRADLCVAVHSRVECQVSQSHGFGPRRTMLVMESTAPITGMWLGDLDGDGKDDSCVDDGAQITCALSP